MLLLCVLLGGLSMSNQKVSASGVEQSVGGRYFTSTNGTLESFLNKSATNQPLYKGIRTEVSGLAVGEDVTVYYNGLVSPNASNSAVVYYDEYNARTMDADAIIWTYTLANERSKQLSIINLQRGGNYYLSIALTDNIEIREGYAYLKGTQQKTVGLSALAEDAPYNGEGCPGGAGLEHKIWADGTISLNKSYNIANILSEEFLQAASEQLSGTEYEYLYTMEYVQSLLSDFGSGAGNNTSILSITYKNVRQDKIAFHIRGISGQWIGDNGGAHPWNGGNTYGFATQKKTTIYLNAENNLADLFNLHTIYLANGAQETNPYGVGYFGTDENGEGGEWFKIENGESVASYKPTDFGKFYVRLGGYIAPNYSALGSYSPVTVFEFDVVEGYPTLSGVEGATTIEGMEYDMSTFFNTWYLGIPEMATFAYEVDGIPHTGNTLLADGKDHEVKLTITDEYGNTGSAIHRIYGTSIQVQAEVSHIVAQGDITVLPVPHVPSGASYTLCVKDESGAIITNNPVYVFNKAGVYTLEYTFVAKGATPIVKTAELIISFKNAVPTLSVNGVYNKEYFVGEKIALLSATADDVLGTQYTVNIQVYWGLESVAVQDGTILLDKEGIYTVAYSVSYDDGKNVIVEKAFKAIKDVIAPEIVVKGTYAETYQTGTVISVFDIVTIDNSELAVENSVAVYYNGNELTLEDKVFVLSEQGTYEIVYTATDLSGNKSEKRHSFTVGENASSDNNEGCRAGCQSTIGATMGAVVTLCGLVLFLRKKES